jgi:NAD(P)-dependent dehydrogenase (short-subunit alcohol dehydrogenase family)
MPDPGGTDMSEARNAAGRPVAVVVGATSKWQADGPNTRLLLGGPVDDGDLPVSARWGVGGAICQKFASEGFFVVMTTRKRANAEGLARAIGEQGGAGMIVELDLGVQPSVAAAFETVRREAGEPQVVIYNAGYLEGRGLPKAQELMEHFPLDMFETAVNVACRGTFWVAREALPGMRKQGRGSLFFTNNPLGIRGRKRHTGESLYYPRVMVRALAQALTEEYSEHGVHVANINIDGGIDSPGLRLAPGFRREALIDPMKIAEACWYLHQQHPSCWTHEIQLTPSVSKPSY